MAVGGLTMKETSVSVPVAIMLTEFGRDNTMLHIHDYKTDKC